MTENLDKSKKSRMKPSELEQSAMYSNYLNNSTSKMLYTIPKSPRNPEKKAQYEPKMYDLPSIRSNRSASFGFGNKVDISKLSNNSPPPNSYIIHSEFQPKKNKGIAIGLGRQLVKAVSAFGQKSFVVPGVGSYTIKQPKNQKVTVFSGRVVDLSEKWIKQVPGPGTYHTLQLLDKNLKSQVGKYESARSQKFSKGEERGQEQRFIKKQNLPGPGQYSVPKDSYEFIDRFAINKGLSFTKCSRPDIANRNGSPGPGSYKHISEFIH